MNTCSMRGCPVSQARVARLEWLDRLSVITAIVPVGFACSSRARNACQCTLLRDGAQRDGLSVADPHTPVDPGLVRSAAVGQRRLGRWPSVLQPAGGSKVRGVTGPSSSAAMTVVFGGGWR